MVKKETEYVLVRGKEIIYEKKNIGVKRNFGHLDFGLNEMAWLVATHGMGW